MNIWRLKGCTQCGGDLFAGDGEWGCIQCYYFPKADAPIAFPSGPQQPPAEAMTTGARGDGPVA